MNTRARVDSGHLGYGDLFGRTSNLPEGRGRIDRSVGKGNALFLGHIANGMSRTEIEHRYRNNEYPDLHPGLAQDAMAQAGLAKKETLA